MRWETYVVIVESVDIVIGGVVVATRGRGHFAGELGVIDGEPRLASIVAATDVTLLAFAAPALRSLILTSRALRPALLRGMAEQVRCMELLPSP